MRKTHRSPAMPRRVPSASGGALAMSSVTRTVRTSTPDVAQLALGGAEVDHVARVVAVAEQDAAARVDLARDAHRLPGRR